jgi:hypothetical protein
VVPPDGAAAQLVRDADVGVVAAPEDVDAIRDAIVALHARWLAGTLDGTPLSREWRDRLARGTRVEELAELLRGLE